jgi:hypothetical protein
MKDPYNWYDPAHPQRGRDAIETPTTRARQWQMECFDEGNRLGGIKQGLQFMQDAATERRLGPERYIPPA